MTLINTADSLYLGDNSVARAYLGESLVWPTGDASTLSVVLTKVAGQAEVRTSTSYGGLQPDWYKIYLSESGGAWVFRHEGAGTDPLTHPVSYSKQYQAKAESFKNGVLLNTALSSVVTTDPAPPPPTQQKVVTLGRVEWGTWKGNGSQRFHNTGSLYSGYYDSTNGNQKSACRFDIPADVRWCKSIDKIELSAWNDWAFSNGGRTVRMALHHNTSLAGDAGRFSTGVFANEHADKPGWVKGGEWLDITNYFVPGRYYVWDEFRRHNAQGIHFYEGLDTNQGWYGSVRNDVRLRITYTVYT